MPPEAVGLVGETEVFWPVEPVTLGRVVSGTVVSAVVSSVGSAVCSAACSVGSVVTLSTYAVADGSVPDAVAVCTVGSEGMVSSGASLEPALRTTKMTMMMSTRTDTPAAAASSFTRVPEAEGIFA